MVAVNPQLIVAKKGVSASDLRELIAWVKANQDKVSVGIGGFGSPSHVAAVYFQTVIGAKVQIVPYRGAAPAMNDLLAGHVDMMFDQAANSLPQVRAGTIKAYAVTASTRLAAAPNIPTVDEAGLAKFYMSIWHGIWTPKGTPKNVTARLNAAIVESLAGVWSTWDRRSRRASSRRPSIWRPTTRPKSKSGGRSSRPPGSKGSKDHGGIPGSPAASDGVSQPREGKSLSILPRTALAIEAPSFVAASLLSSVRLSVISCRASSRVNSRSFSRPATYLEIARSCTSRHRPA